jgi:hypothetical protein
MKIEIQKPNKEDKSIKVEYNSYLFHISCDGFFREVELTI